MDEQAKRCPKCGEAKALDEFFRNRARHDGVSGYCRDCQTATNRQGHLQFRYEVMDLLGGRRCVGPDEKGCPWRVDDLRVLTIDHVDGGGVRHRKDAGSEFSVLRYAKEHPSEFRVLCWNCNHLARIASGQSGKRYAAAVAAAAGREKVTRPPRWARDFDACVECGTTETPHRSRGLCRNCYMRAWRTST